MVWQFFSPNHAVVFSPSVVDSAYNLPASIRERETAGFSKSRVQHAVKACIQPVQLTINLYVNN